MYALSELTAKYPSIRFSFFSYLQAHIYVTNLTASFTAKEWNPALYKALSHTPTLRGHTSQYYKFLHTPLNYMNSTVAMTEWIHDTPSLTIPTLLTALERGMKYLPSSRYLTQ